MVIQTATRQWFSYTHFCILSTVIVLSVQVLEPDFFQYLSERPLGNDLFYCYRWFLVAFKRGIYMYIYTQPQL